MKIAIVGSRGPGNINFAQELERCININASETIIPGGQGALIPLPTKNNSPLFRLFVTFQTSPPLPPMWLPFARSWRCL